LVFGASICSKTLHYQGARSNIMLKQRCPPRIRLYRLCLTHGCNVDVGWSTLLRFKVWHACRNQRIVWQTHKTVCSTLRGRSAAARFRLTSPLRQRWSLLTYRGLWSMVSPIPVLLAPIDASTYLVTCTCFPCGTSIIIIDFLRCAFIGGQRSGCQ